MIRHQLVKRWIYDIYTISTCMSPVIPTWVKMTSLDHILCPVALSLASGTPCNYDLWRVSHFEMQWVPRNIKKSNAHAGVVCRRRFKWDALKGGQILYG